MTELTIMPKWASVAQARLNEPVAGPVSSKVAKSWGWTCPECQWTWYPPEGSREYPVEGLYHDEMALARDGWKEFPTRRCSMCRSHMKRWRTAKRVFVELDELRMNEEIKYLRFCTFTRRAWNILVREEDAAEEKRKLKSRSVNQFRLWRQRNAWWKSRNANGQYWPECVETLEEDGQMRLHFHIHAVLVCEFLDNKPKRSADGAKIVADSKCYQEWGGIFDVKAVKDYQVPYQVAGETRKGCGRKACMKYLSKYISKAKGWRSQPIGEWRKWKKK